MLRLESIDTNIIIRLTTGDNPTLFERARELVDTPRCIFFVPDQVILESIFQLTNKRTYNLDRKTAALRLQDILSIPRLDYDKVLFDKVFDDYLKHPKLSIVDCYLAEKMQDIERAPLWTFDEKLARQLPSARLA